MSTDDEDPSEPTGGETGDRSASEEVLIWGSERSVGPGAAQTPAPAAAEVEAAS